MNRCRMVSVALLLCCLSVTADEGFWQLTQQTELATQLANNHANKQGQRLNKLFQLSQHSTVQVNNCSGGLVSKQGLVLTNYSCLANTLAVSRSPLTTEGFVASGYEVERPLVGSRISIPQQVEDVTLVINRQLDAQLAPEQRLQQLQQLTEQLIVDCEQRSRLHCQLHTFDGGLQYRLVKSLQIRDVRLVYAPNQSLVRLTPNTADYTWPQYSADYVFVRGYVNANGQAAEFSSQNIPYTTEHFLTFSAKGVTEQEHILVAGFPKHSQRYQTAAAVSLQFEQFEPLKLQYQQQALALLQQHTASNNLIAEKYRHQLQSLSNAIAHEQARLTRFRHSAVSNNKLAQEAKLEVWINGSLVRRQLYSKVLQRISDLNQQQYQLFLRDLTLQNFSYVQLPTLARQLYQFALLRQTQTRNTLELSQVKQSLAQSMQLVAEHFDSRVDQSLALHFLAEYAKLAPEHRLTDLDHYFGLNDGFNVEIVRHKLAAIYRGSRLSEAEQRQAWLTASVTEFQHSQDSLISFAVAMQESHENILKQRQQLAAELAQIWPAYIEVWQAFYDANNLDFYADANGTLRLSLGQIKGFQHQDAVWYQAFSSAKGVIDNFAVAKASTKQVPAVQQLLQQLQQTQQQNLPINFLSSIDITAGHAGAVTLNWQGHLVGVVATGTGEAVISAWHYDERYSRAIHVDSRYILWQLQQDQLAKALLAELSLSN
jgi:hypothetical protein